MEGFFSDLVVELVGFALTSIAVYLIFQRRERKSQERLVKAVYVRLKNKIINPFVAQIIENLRSDVVRPSGFSSLLLGAPIASTMAKMEQLQEKLLESFKKKDISGSFSARNEQWKIVISEDFLMMMKRIVGYWSSKQWGKYYVNLERSLTQIRNLLDLYQSRLPSEAVSKLIQYENKVDIFTRTMSVFPEFFGRIDELKIPITSEFLASRRSFQYTACESLHSIFEYVDGLRATFEFDILDRPLPPKQRIDFEEALKKYPKELFYEYVKQYPHNPEGVLEWHIHKKMKRGKTREQAIEELAKESK